MGTSNGNGNTLPDIDSRIDYQTFYKKYLDRPVVSGENMTSRCPVHKAGQERNASFSVSLRTGKYQCHGCDASGNVWTFLQWAQNVSAEEAKLTVKAHAGLVDLATRNRGAGAKITVAKYAEAKGLTVEFLESLGLKDSRSQSYISIPYIDSTGEIRCTRRRNPKTAGARFTWMPGAAGKIIPYGVWRLPDATRPVVLLEGESDCHALWSNGIDNTYGIPGASNCKDAWIRDYFLKSPEILLHIEPGEGGQTFLKKTCQAIIDAGYGGKVKAFSTIGHKDPSDLHLAIVRGKEDGKFIDRWQRAIDAAEFVIAADHAKATEEDILLPGSPVQLRLPQGWTVDQQGVHLQVTNKDGEVGSRTVCPVPLVMSKRLRNIDTSDEKVEIAYQRDGSWHAITSKRSVVFTSRSIVELADRGLPVSSDRAKDIVKYLDALEAANLDTLPRVRSVERMGWMGAKTFLPGVCDDIVLDPPQGSEHLADAYHQNGTIDAWKAAVSPIRERHPIARFMLAASFATILLRDAKQRVSIVHVYGASRGGKTAALKMALSAWGSPESLMATFNSTKVGLERLAGFYNDLPLGVDERQVIGKDQNLAESLVYMLGAGKGKVRGAKHGGLQSFQSWRTIALTTGEEGLSKSSSHTGVRTRALEIYGKPISEESLASEIHRTIDQNYGIAGPMFVREYLNRKAEGSIDLDAELAGLVKQAKLMNPKCVSSHAAAAALIILADKYLSEWVFGSDDLESLSGALTMGQTVLDLLDSEEDMDYQNRSLEWMEGWVAQHLARFGWNKAENDYRDDWGFVEKGVVWISPTVLENALERDGFSPSRVLRDLAQYGSLATYSESDGTLRYRQRKTFNCNRVRMIGFTGQKEYLSENHRANLGATGPISDTTGPQMDWKKWHE